VSDANKRGANIGYNVEDRRNDTTMKVENIFCWSVLHK